MVRSHLVCQPRSNCCSSNIQSRSKANLIVSSALKVFISLQTTYHKALLCTPCHNTLFSTGAVVLVQKINPVDSAMRKYLVWNMETQAVRQRHNMSCLQLAHVLTTQKPQTIYGHITTARVRTHGWLCQEQCYISHVSLLVCVLTMSLASQMHRSVNKVYNICNLYCSKVYMLKVALMSQYTYRCVLINDDRHRACRCLYLSICNYKH